MTVWEIVLIFIYLLTGAWVVFLIIIFIFLSDATVFSKPRLDFENTIKIYVYYIKISVGTSVFKAQDEIKYYS